jgi:hypothetical protein
VLRTLPYHASGYGKPRSGRLHDDYPNREGEAMLAYIRVTWHEHKCISPPIGRTVLYKLAVLTLRAHRAHLARQESIVYRRTHGAAPGAPLWSTHIHSLEL